MSVDRGESDRDEGIQSRSAALLSLLVRGLLWGLAATLVSGVAGYLLATRNRAGILTGLNWGGTVLWMLAGAFIWSEMQLGQRENSLRGLVGQSGSLPQLPWAQSLVVFLAGTVCFLAWWAVHSVFPK